MTGKRFELKINPHGQADIIDWVESEGKNAICIYNDLGVLPFSSAKALCNLLNELYSEVMFLRTKNTLMNLVISEVIDDLTEQAETKEPIIISKEYVEWVKKNQNMMDELFKG